MKDNLIPFPDMKNQLNALRIQLALESIEEPLDEYLALNQIVVGLQRYFDRLEGSEEMLLQIGYLSFLIDDFYERIV